MSGAGHSGRSAGCAVAIALLVAAGTAAAARSAAAAFFSDATAAAGIDAPQSWGQGQDLGLFAGGVAAGDVDRDGWIDLCIVRGVLGPPRLLRNRGDGTFEDASEAAGLSDATGLFASAALADVDGDGWLDLLLLGILGTPPQLRPNRGDGGFGPPDAGALALSGAAFSASFGDVDRDGDLDLFVSRWGGYFPEGTSSGHLWRNRGDGTFEDATVAAGIVPFPNRAGLPRLDMSFTGNFADIDSDGWPDLLVAADYGGSAILHNEGDGTFAAVVANGVPNDENGMGAAVGDIDGDGDLDWFVSSIADPDGVAEGYWGVTGNRLYRNDGTGRFSDDTTAAGVREGGWGWGTTLADLDNDGDPDIAQVNGYGYGAETSDFLADPTRLFLNDGSGGFAESAAALGAATTGNDRGIAAFDVDRDGDLDLLLSSNHGAPVLLRNDGAAPGAAWVRLRGAAPNTEAIGARVRLRAAGRDEMRELRAGSNYASQDPAEAFFGLGGADAVERLEVSWPGGATTVLHGLAPGGIVLDEPAAGDGACAAEASVNPCVPGSPSPVSTTECLVEWRVRQAGVARDRRGNPLGRISCRHGDPGCDDGSTDGACTFAISLCTANADPRLPACAPGDVARAGVLSPRRTSRIAAEREANRRLEAALGPAGGIGVVPGVFRNASPGHCETLRIAVPLGAGGRRPGRMTLGVRAGASDGRSDADRIALSCLPGDP